MYIEIIQNLKLKFFIADGKKRVAKHGLKMIFLTFTSFSLLKAFYCICHDLFVGRLNVRG